MKIGITFSHPHYPSNPQHQQRIARYVDAVNDAGGEGIPLWRPRNKNSEKLEARATKLARQLDGLIVSGGRDLDPALFGEELNPKAKVNLVHPLRPAFEAELVRIFREHKKPLFGICYGCQFFNVFGGGTLLQDVPLQWPNAIAHSDARHRVRLEKNSLLHRFIGQREFEVASSHHQAIARTATGTRITAHAPDGIIEAIELDDDPLWIGVQWHPECDRESLATQRLFGAFISACQK